MQKVRVEMNTKQTTLSKQKAVEINQNLEDIMSDIHSLVQENIALKE